jgi:hypothetical protein
MTSYERALQRLGQVPLPEFIAARTEIAAELRKEDKGAAARVAERRKPTASVWVVNQLYWRSREQFDDLLAAGARLRAGEVGASRAYRTALADLRAAAIALLRKSGLGAADATLRKVVATLSAIGAAGSFDPNPPGALEHDLDAPGFEAMGSASLTALDEKRAHGRPVAPSAPARSASDRRTDREQARDRELERNQAREHERQRVADERAQAREAAAQRKQQAHDDAVRRAALARASKASADAKRKVAALEADVVAAENELTAAREQLAAAQERARKAREQADDLERQVTELERGGADGASSHR